MAATDQAVATAAALTTLARGGSAADAAVAADAVLGVVQPMSTGVGGDGVALVAGHGRVDCYVGGGAAAARLDPEPLIHAGRLDPADPRLIVVPGVVDLWINLLERFGRLDLGTVLEPAMKAATGAPIGPAAARSWARFDAGRELLGAAPGPLAQFTNPALGRFLRRLGDEGRASFYTGVVAAGLADAVAAAGGSLGEEDLTAHAGEWLSPIQVPIGDHVLVEPPPPHGGVVTALAMLHLQQLAVDVAASVDSMDQAFEAVSAVVADPRRAPVDVDALLRTRRHESRSHSRREVRTGGTVMVMVADSDGTMVALGSSLFQGFGSGVVVPEIGVCLNDRGYGFTPVAGHPNAPAPGARPYHTVMPALLLDRSGAPRAAFGFAGGDMQPQAQVQLLTRLLEGETDPQAALDAPRWHSDGGGRVGVEAAGMDSIGSALTDAGFDVHAPDESIFGRGQVVLADAGGWLVGASDGRGDGLAAGLM